MSRKSGKARAASSKAVSSFGASPFGSFGSAASGISLSYLAEPPDFSSISDANVVVSLKNLQKKDATTKAKALEELLSFVQAHPYEQDGGVEEPVLEAWVGLSSPPLRPDGVLLVMRISGPILPSCVHRQLETCARTLPYPAIRAHEISPETDGEEGAQGCWALARRHI